MNKLTKAKTIGMIALVALLAIPLGVVLAEMPGGEIPIPPAEGGASSEEEYTGHFGHFGHFEYFIDTSVGEGEIWRTTEVVDRCLRRYDWVVSEEYPGFYEIRDMDGRLLILMEMEPEDPILEISPDSPGMEVYEEYRAVLRG